MLKTRSLLRAAMLLCAAALALPQAALAGDIAAGKIKAQTLCAACHGENGIAVLPGAANLSGQQKEYLREQLRAFRSGSRQNPQMTVIGKALTDADIENLAEWYAAIKVTVELPE